MSNVPEGWEVTQIRNLGIWRGGSTPSMSDSSYWTDGNILWISPKDIRSSVISESEMKVTETALQESRLSLFGAGCVVVVFRSGILRHTFPVAMVDKPFTVNQDLKVLGPASGLDSRFVFYLLLANSEAIRRVAVKTGTTVESVDTASFMNYSLLLPPLPEQRKIAAILSTWDEAITLTERLIAALKARKQALMQLLLTGEVRFPGFDGEWDQLTLGEAFDRVERSIRSPLDAILSITATVGFVDQRSKFGRTIAGENLARYIHLKRGEFAYNKGNSNAYPQGCIYRLEEYEEGAVPNVYYCFSGKPHLVLSDFYKYYFENGSLNQQLSRLINTGVRNDGLLNLPVDRFFSVDISVPPLNEQKHLAELFDYLASEINLTEKALAALKAEKRGLMQQLLTGAIRVQVEE